MAITTFSSREFSQDAGRAKKATTLGPVFITDRGRAAHVLLTIEDYQRLAGVMGGIVDLLAQPGAEDVPFDPPRVGDEVYRPADLG